MSRPANAIPLWTSGEAAAATGGKASHPWSASGVSIDSRSVEAGDLFVALAGPNHDGHDFVEAAFERSAAAAMVSRRPGARAGARPLLLVVDTYEGLGTLAARARERSGAHVVAITGSVGKTGTKELLAGALGRCGPTHASAGNLNNHIGVPLSLARLPQGARYGVFEAGMNHPGEIAPLSRLIRPHTALITTIAPAHTEAFSGLDGVADAKAEIFQGLEPGGTAVLNRDNAYFERLADAARTAGAGRIVSFGEGAEADARLLAWRPGGDGRQRQRRHRGRRGRVRDRLLRSTLGLQQRGGAGCGQGRRRPARTRGPRAPHRRAGGGPRRAPSHSPRRRPLHADRRELQREPGCGPRRDRDAGRGGAARARRQARGGARRHAGARHGGGALAWRARLRPGAGRDRPRVHRGPPDGPSAPGRRSLPGAVPTRRMRRVWPPSWRPGSGPATWSWSRARSAAAWG